ncbi:MAG TPA: 30S ribosome-binding factor RbfA [Gammaproteobacteria bacterium]|nr:30S ribosome-binding factor RbfA [Gammaproteobacteria bacterium]
MPKEYTRSQRVEEQIQRILSQVIPREIKDPRLGMVTVSAVDVSRKLSIAKVFVTLLGGEGKIKDRIEILNKTSGFLRSELAKNITMRHVPELRFFYDVSIERGAKLSALIDQAIDLENSSPDIEEKK